MTIIKRDMKTIVDAANTLKEAGVSFALCALTADEVPSFADTLKETLQGWVRLPSRVLRLPAPIERTGEVLSGEGILSDASSWRVIAPGRALRFTQTKGEDFAASDQVILGDGLSFCYRVYWGFKDGRMTRVAWRLVSVSDSVAQPELYTDDDEDPQ